MRFCGKCHKMVVKIIINASDLSKICCCDLGSDTILTGNVASSLITYVSGSDRTGNKRKAMKIIDEVFQRAEERLETE